MKNPAFLAVLVAVIAVVMLPIAQTGKYIAVGALFLSYFYLKRGYLLVVFASTKFNKGGDENLRKAWLLYEKGWRAGIAPNYAHMLGNLFVQRGDPAIALEIFDSLIEKGRQGKKGYATILKGAVISRSMALWVTGKKKEAVKSLYEIKSSGYIDTNLAVNLGSYLLDLNRLDEMESLLEDLESMTPQTSGMKDNRGYYLFKRGSLLEAEALYRDIINEDEPKFPEAYVHAAEVKIALGKYGSARSLLEQSLAHPFYHTSTITESEVHTLLGEVVDNSQSLGEDEDEEESDLHSELFDFDLFDDDGPNIDLDEDDEEIEPNIELDDIDYADENDDEVIIDPDDISQMERDMFDDSEEEDGDFRQP